MPRSLIVRWSGPLPRPRASTALTDPRNHWVPPPGRHTWSNSLRSMLLDGVGVAGLNVTGPAVEARTGVQGPRQVGPESSSNWLGPTSFARRAAYRPGPPSTGVVSGDCCWKTMLSFPSKPVRRTDIEGAGL